MDDILGENIAMAEDTVKKTRIFIGIPAFGDFDAEVVQSFIRWIYRLGRDYPDCQFFMGIKSKSEQARARNQIVNSALAIDCDYILMIDDDMVIEDNQTDFLRKLLDHNVPAVGILFWQRGGEYRPVMMHEVRTKDREVSAYVWFTESEIEYKLQEVDVIGGGLMLIKAEVFLRMLEPYFWYDGTAGTDIYICNRIRELGYKCYVDTSIELGHRESERRTVNSKTKPPMEEIEKVRKEVEEEKLEHHSNLWEARESIRRTKGGK
jgi:hypothetical protein